MELPRRSLLGLAAAAPLAAAVGTAPAEEILPLWPQPPQRRGPPLRETLSSDGMLTGVANPRLRILRPAEPNGAAVLVIPGGSYHFLAIDNEGTDPARRLAAAGFTAAILVYRLPDEGWDRQSPVPLQDAQQATRLLRAHASRLNIRPNAIAALGFSAGGHLAGLLATAADPADMASARPNLAGLIYPVVSLSAPFTHSGSRDALLGPDAPASLREHYSIEQRVTAATPPLFIVHAADDEIVPVANSLALHGAMLAAKRPAELHVFNEGGHGFGTHLPAAVPTAHWPELFVTFARRMLTAPGTPLSHAGSPK